MDGFPVWGILGWTSLELPKDESDPLVHAVQCGLCSLAMGPAGLQIGVFPRASWRCQELSLGPFAHKEHAPPLSHLLNLSKLNGSAGASMPPLQGPLKAEPSQKRRTQLP